MNVIGDLDLGAPSANWALSNTCVPECEQASVQLLPKTNDNRSWLNWELKICKCQALALQSLLLYSIRMYQEWCLACDKVIPAGFKRDSLHSCNCAICHVSTKCALCFWENVASSLCLHLALCPHLVQCLCCLPAGTPSALATIVTLAFQPLHWKACQL